MSREPVKRKAPVRNKNFAGDRPREEAPRNISDRTIGCFVNSMKEYAHNNNLGQPTLLFDQGIGHFGVCLDWRDDRRAFTFSKASWTVADYQRLCDKLRTW
jgi:hypothetical protein